MTRKLVGHHIGSIVFRGMFRLVASTAMAACSSISVESNGDISVDFSRFQTFGLIDNPEPTVNRLIDERTRTAISANLEPKGLRKLNDYQDTDLTIGFEVTIERRATYHTIRSG